MAKTQRELLVTWLNDAYATEQAQEKMLERAAGHFDGQPNIQDELKRHLEETRQQAEDIKACIDRLGGKTSGAKSVLGTLTGTLQGMQSGSFHDEQVKDLLMLHGAEHFEHASYIALAAAARELGEDDIADICERIAEEEQATAEWVMDVIPDVVRSVMLEQEPAQA